MLVRQFRRAFAPLTALNPRVLSASKRFFAAPATQEKLVPEASMDQASPKVEKLVADITRLTLLETAQLVKQLKIELNLQDAVMAMPMQNAPAAQGAAAPAAVEEEKPAEKTEFTLKLDKVDAAVKAKVIREIKGILPGANLIEAKKFVESAPKVIKENVPKDEAEKIKKLLEAAGAKVLLE